MRRYACISSQVYNANLMMIVYAKWSTQDIKQEETISFNFLSLNMTDDGQSIQNQKHSSTMFPSHSLNHFTPFHNSRLVSYSDFAYCGYTFIGIANS